MHSDKFVHVGKGAAPVSNNRQHCVNDDPKFDMSILNVKLKVKEHIVDIGRGVVFDTAGGEVPASRVVLLHISHTTQEIQPFVLGSPPNMLSVGQRCQRQGWRFCWEPFSSRP